jgi:hypothetical protein
VRRDVADEFLSKRFIAIFLPVSQATGHRSAVVATSENAIGRCHVSQASNNSMSPQSMGHPGQWNASHHTAKAPPDPRSWFLECFCPRYRWRFTAVIFAGDWSPRSAVVATSEKAIGTCHVSQASNDSTPSRSISVAGSWSVFARDTAGDLPRSASCESDGIYIYAKRAEYQNHAIDVY